MNAYKRFQLYEAAGYQGELWPQAPGEKRPSAMYKNGSIGYCAGFFKREYDIEWAKKIDPSCGVMIRTMKFLFIDVDIPDEQLARKIRKIARLHLGRGALRTRTGSAKFGILYRSKSIGNLSSVLFSRKYVDTPNGLKSKSEQVEFLTGKHVFVAEGIHPDGDNYEFELMNTSKLPIVGREQLKNLQNEINELPKGIIEKHPKYGDRGTSGSVENHKDLYGEDMVVLSDGTSLTVREILQNKSKYHGRACHDPYEPGYRNGQPDIAKIYSDQQNPLIRTKMNL